MAKIGIAGGTGLVGKALEKRLLQESHEVYILTRSPTKDNHVAWNPKNKSIDTNKIQGTEYLINLCGENVAESRWTDKRKKQLLNSRVETTQFLYEQFHQQKSLKQYLSASGIDVYPLDQKDKEMKEEDAFGSNYLSQLVKNWEESADVFSRIVPVAKLRISMVLDLKGGAIKKLMPLVKYRIASPVGSGNQCATWVHIDDVAGAFNHAIDKSLDGAFNITGQPVTNRLFMNELMKHNDRKMWAPNVPRVLLKWILGERSTILVDGAFTDRIKFKETGYNYLYPSLQDAFQELFNRK